MKTLLSNPKKPPTITPVMKKDIHPAYYKEAEVRCACGKTFTLGATQQKIQVEICSNCHPFYTGKQNLIDTAGRAERFKSRAAKADTKKVVKKKEKKVTRVAKKKPKVIDVKSKPKKK